jgi:cell division protein FtsL
MEELVTFVQGAIGGGVAYDAVKVSLGSHFDKLSSYLSNGEDSKFEAALEMLFEENKELKQQIIDLQEGKRVNSIKIGGNSSGVNVIGNNNNVNRK